MTFSSQLRSRWSAQLLFKRFLFRFNQWFHRNLYWPILSRFLLILKCQCFLWWHFPKIQWWLVNQQFIDGSWLIIRRRWPSWFCLRHQLKLRRYLSWLQWFLSNLRGHLMGFLRQYSKQLLRWKHFRIFPYPFLLKQFLYQQSGLFTSCERMRLQLIVKQGQ